MKINERIKKIREHFCNDNNLEFAKRMSFTPQYASNITKEGKNVGAKVLDKILIEFPEVNPVWLKLGEGSMLKGEELQENRHGKLIPFYDDVVTIGGNNDISANMQGVSQPKEYIDTGDWFKDATAALRHYGESMTEYPPGCILALKEVYDRRLIIPGKDYVIETNEYRVTKRIQLGNNCIRAHSTNDEKYEDGSLIHQPFDIPLELVNRIFLVLGYVVKKNGGTMVFSNTK